MSRVVLYIEDDADNVRLVERLIRRHPQAELRVARTGQAGIESAIACRPALILLDNRLPDATGAEILRQLKAAPATGAIPVVMVSGDSGRAAADELLAIGASEFVVKPYDIHQFLDLIARYLP
ncbi:MAG TPA: response regulator [Streptosporangiaceae bacterium]|jgi:CheY-like chemotaxis protein